jgi:hypothetical protein
VISGVECRGAVSLSGSPLVVFGSGLFLCPGLLFFILLARLYRFSGWRIGWGHGYSNPGVARLKRREIQYGTVICVHGE